jgi:hypothetical protein
MYQPLRSNSAFCTYGFRTNLTVNSSLFISRTALKIEVCSSAIYVYFQFYLDELLHQGLKIALYQQKTLKIWF